MKKDIFMPPLYYKIYNFRRIGSINKYRENNRKFIVFDNLKIDLDKYEVSINDENIDVTSKECEILYLIAVNEGRVLSREEILDKIWGYDYFGDTRVVDTQIKRLRKKLPESDEKWSIKTVYGIGYKFEVAK